MEPGSGTAGSLRESKAIHLPAVSFNFKQEPGGDAQVDDANLNEDEVIG